MRVLLGQALGAVGQAEKAEKQLGAACAKAPEDPGTWLALAAFYRGTERDDLAMPALRKVAALGEVPRTSRLKREERTALKRELEPRTGALSARAAPRRRDPKARPSSCCACSTRKERAAVRTRARRGACGADAQRALEAEKPGCRK